MLTGSYQNPAMMEKTQWHLKAPPGPAGQKPAVASKPVENRENTVKTDWYAQIAMVDVTTVSIQPEEIGAQKFLNFFGRHIPVASI